MFRRLMLSGREPCSKAALQHMRNLEMTAWVDLLVHKFGAATPIETKVSNLVAGMLEKTANRLARFEPAEVVDEQEAA